MKDCLKKVYTFHPLALEKWKQCCKKKCYSKPKKEKKNYMEVSRLAGAVLVFWVVTLCSLLP